MDIDDRNIIIEDSKDIEKHILQIHTQSLQNILTNDLILGVLEEKEKKYVSEQVSLAHEASYMIKEKEYRDYAVSRLLLKAVTVVLLNRNVKGNPLTELLLKKKEELLQPPDENMDKALMEKLDRAKRGEK